jgi:pimeloyl-ACP methyl ester carboxylesterase
MGWVKNSLLLAGFGTLLTLGLEAINVRVERGAGPIYNGVGGESKYYLWKHGDIFYAVKGDGPPLVMVHGLNAAANSYELRKNFGPLAEDYRVYAPDLLGFGLSDRPSLLYTGELYVDLLTDFLRDVVREPATVMASSLSASYAIAVAARQPELVKNLVLIEPTGVGNNDRGPGLGERFFNWLIRSRIYGTAIFNAVASRASISAFLKFQTFYDQNKITDNLIQYDYDTSHQHGAKWAPASFVTSYLNLNVRDEWQRLQSPILLVWGRHAQITPVEQAEEFLRLNAQARLEVFEKSGLLPHDEQADEFNSLVRDTLRGVAAA